ERAGAGAGAEDDRLEVGVLRVAAGRRAVRRGGDQGELIHLRLLLSERPTHELALIVVHLGVPGLVVDSYAARLVVQAEHVVPFALCLLRGVSRRPGAPVRDANAADRQGDGDSNDPRSALFGRTEHRPVADPTAVS